MSKPRILFLLIAVVAVVFIYNKKQQSGAQNQEPHAVNQEIATDVEATEATEGAVNSIEGAVEGAKQEATSATEAAKAEVEAATDAAKTEATEAANKLKSKIEDVAK